jgi:ABC-type sugar transport system, permease component
MNTYLKQLRGFAKYALIGLLACILLFPVYWMLVSSFMPNSYLMSLPPHFLPENPTAANYLKIFTNAQYLTYFKNSFLVSSFTVVLCLIVSILSGYGFSRYTFKGKNIAMTSILTVQMFPIVAILITLYTFYFKWGMINSYRGLILADTTFCLPLSVALMKAFFDTIPRSLDESSKIDGCGRLRTLFSVLLPLTIPGLIAVGVYTFLHSWDDFLFSLVIMQKDTMKTLPVGLAQSFLGEYAHDYAGMMTFAVSASAPIVILFIFFQKYLIAGLTAGAVKG